MAPPKPEDSRPTARQILETVEGRIIEAFGLWFALSPKGQIYIALAANWLASGKIVVMKWIRGKERIYSPPL